MGADGRAEPFDRLKPHRRVDRQLRRVRGKGAAETENESGQGWPYETAVKHRGPPGRKNDPGSVTRTRTGDNWQLRRGEPFRREVPIRVAAVGAGAGSRE